MQKPIARSLTIIIATSLLLGAGCRPPKPTTVPPPPPVTITPEVPTPPVDPLADDLDAAIEDLNAIE